MKKTLCLLMLLALVLPLAGCAQAQKAIPDTSNDPWGLVLTASNVKPTGCSLTFTQSGGEEITGTLEYGSYFSVEREEDGAWSRVPYIPSDHARAWNDIAYPIPMDSSESVELEWDWLYGELPAGHYRIVKSIMDFREPGNFDNRDYYAEFEIK